MKKDACIYVAGHRGLVGNAIMLRLHQAGYTNVVSARHDQVDLLQQDDVDKFFRYYRPEYVFLAAAKVGGICAHVEKPASFLFENLRIQENVINSAFQTGVKKLLFLGSACAYPKHAPTPIREEYLMTGELEPTNRGYVLAKIAGHEMCKAFRAQFGCDFISCIPTNLYGVGDNYNLGTSHVLPGMLHRMHNAKKGGNREVTLWGTGKPTREFLFNFDLAEACIFLMQHYGGAEPINVGTGVSISLAELSLKIAKRVGFGGKIEWDHSKPDGTPHRRLDCSKIFDLGWKPTTSLDDGIQQAYDDFLCRNEQL